MGSRTVETTADLLDGWRWVLGYCRPEPTASMADVGDHQWRSIVDAATRARCLGLLHHYATERGDLDALEPEVRHGLSLEMTRLAARHASLGSIVVPELTALAETVDFLVIKGPALAHSIYPTPLCRTFGDVDLLVAPEDLARALAVLTDRGYEFDTSFSAGHGPACSLALPGGDVVYLELKDDLSRPRQSSQLRGGDPWGAARECEMWGHTFRIPSPEYLSASALFQLSWDLWQGGYARYLVDLVHLHAWPDCDGDLLEALIAKSGLRGLDYCARQLADPDSPIPPPYPRAARATRYFVHSRPDLAFFPIHSRAARSRAVLATVALYDEPMDRCRWAGWTTQHAASRAWRMIQGPLGRG